MGYIPLFQIVLLPGDGCCWWGCFRSRRVPWPDGEPAVLGPRCARAAAKCAIVASIWLHCDHPSSCPYSLTACAISAFSGLPQLQAALLGTTIQILLSPLQVLANSALDCHSPGHRDMVITTSLNAAGLVAPPCPSGIGRRLFKYDLYSMGCPDRPVTTSIANPAASRPLLPAPWRGLLPLMLRIGCCFYAGVRLYRQVFRAIWESPVSFKSYLTFRTEPLRTSGHTLEEKNAALDATKTNPISC